MENTRKIKLTKAEQKWIEAFTKVVNKAPESLQLFGSSGNLKVVKYAPFKTRYNESLPFCVADGFKMSCDGGDPVDGEDIINYPEIEYM